MKKRQEWSLACLIGVCISISLTRALWQLQGFPAFVDFNIPATSGTTLISIGRFLQPWDWFINGGRPNPAIFSEPFALAGIFVLQVLFGANLGGSAFLMTTVFAGFIATYATVRTRAASFPSAILAAAFFVANPWYYDELAQGHYYFLLLAPAVIYLLSSWAENDPWSPRRWLGLTLATAYVFALDFRYSLIIVAAFAIVLVRSWRSALVRARLASAIFAAILVVWVYVPMLVMFPELKASNSPGGGSLAAFSQFTSLVSALTLLRYNQNAQLVVPPSAPLWGALWMSAALVIIVIVGAILKESDRRKRDILLAWIAVGIVIGAGTNPPFGFIVDVLAGTVPILGMVLRDPSKGLLLTASVATLALARYRFAVPDGAVARNSLAMIARRLGDTPLAVIAPTLAVIVYLLPFVVTPFGSAYAIPQDELDRSRAAYDAAVHSVGDTHPRITAIPSGVLVRYDSNARRVYDPLQLFPSAGLVRVSVDYDFDDSSNAARFALAGLDAGTLALPGAALADLGVSAVAVRPGVFGEYDSSDENALLTPSRDPLTPVLDLVSNPGGIAPQEEPSLAIASQQLALVDRDRALVDDARSLQLVPRSFVWTFDSIPDAGALQLASPGAPPPGQDVPLHELGGTWRTGDTLWARDGGLLLRTPTFAAIGDGGADGSLRAHVPAGTYKIYAHVLVRRDPIRYGFTLNGQRFDTPVREVTSDHFAWFRLGTTVVGQAESVQVAVHGLGSRVGADALRFVPVRASGRHDLVIAQLSGADAAPGLSENRTPFSSAGHRLYVDAQNVARLVRIDDVHVAGSSVVVSLHGRADRAKIQISAGGRACNVRLPRLDGIVRCILPGPIDGPVTLSVHGGTVDADLIGFSSSPAVGVATATPVRLREESSAFDIDPSGTRSFVCVKIADPRLWLGPVHPVGSCLGYGQLFHTDAGHYRFVFAASRPEFAACIADGLVLAFLIALTILRARAHPARSQQPN